MMRICSSLANNGFEATIVGVAHNKSTALTEKKYKQKRLPCYFKKGYFFYAEYNIRLFFFLLFAKADAFCCIDLDTLLPVYIIGKARRKIIVYDAHEYFSQLKEVITRPSVYRIWHWIERHFVPKIKNGYTVSQSIANVFHELYHVDYSVIMNVPLLKEQHTPVLKNKNVLLYQGAVNHARGLEYLIPAMNKIDAVLHIYGQGNMMEEIKKLIQQHHLEDRVLLLGNVTPHELTKVTPQALMGINLVEPIGLNQYYSLANKFFDYMHASIPQISMNFPEYKRINDEIEVAVLIDTLEIDTIANAINSLLQNKEKYHQLESNCAKAAQQYNWQNEEKKLIAFYKNILR